MGDRPSASAVSTLSNRAAERTVFINGHRYNEGDTTAEGASIEEITRDGVIMSSGGNRFLLPRD